MLGYVLFADLRGFSTWSLQAEYEQISSVYEVISHWIAKMVIDYPFEYWKLLGDGIMLIWDSGDNESNAVDCSIGAAYELHKRYWYFRKEAPYEVPVGFGIAIYGGNFTKITSATKLTPIVKTKIGLI